MAEFSLGSQLMISEPGLPGAGSGARGVVTRKGQGSVPGSSSAMYFEGVREPHDC